MMTRKPRPNRRSGLSLVEVVLAASLLGILARALVLTSDSLGRITSTGNTQGVLRTEGEKAAHAVIQDLRRSGVFGQVELNGKTYPYFFENGQPDDPEFDEHTHAPANSEAQPGDSDFGPNREIVFVLPADLDRDDRPDLDTDFDGVPELDGNGDGEYTDEVADVGQLWDEFANGVHPTSGVVWSFDEISYVVNTAPDGINYLERRVNNGDGGVRRVAKNVERVVFENFEDALDEIAPDAVRMRIYLRRRTPEGVLMRHEMEVSVSLRNGESFDYEVEN